MSAALALAGRGLRHHARNPDALATALALPVLLLLLFVYVFGGAIQAPGDYVDYVVPGIVVLSAGFGSAATAVGVTEDMTSGTVDRLRAMDVPGAAVVGAHVAATVLRNVASTAIVVGLALAIGFAPSASAPEWLAAAGLLVLFMTAIAWLSACFGLLVRSVDAASACAFFVMFLPYVSSGFVPPSTMPAALEAFAGAQPVTPLVDTLRALLTGMPGGDAAAAAAWWAGACVLGAAAAALLYRRRTER
jgi:ABC-2 type transport system permease protein